MLFDEVDTLCTDGLVQLKYKPYFDLNDDLYVFAKDRKFGIASYSGKILYESVFDFVNKADDYGVVIKNHEYGIIDNKGKMIADIKYKDIDYVNNCKRFILNDYSSCYLVSKEQNIIYKSSDIIHIGEDLFLCKDENIIIDADGNKVMDTKDKHTYSARYDYIVELENNEKIRNFYDRNGKFIYKTKRKCSFLGKNGLVISKYGKTIIYNLEKNEEVKIPNNLSLDETKYLDMGLGFLIFRDKKLKMNCLFSLNNGFVYLDESLSDASIYEITNKYICGRYWGKNGCKDFVCDLNGNLINKDYRNIKRNAFDFIIVSDDSDNVGMINSNNEIVLPLKKQKINYSDGYFFVSDNDNNCVYNKDMNLIYSSDKKIELVSITESFILLSIEDNKTLLDKEGNIIIESVTGDINLRNDHIILYNDYVINLNSEYINLDTDYELLVQGYVFHNKSSEEREYLKKRIVYETEIIISKYFNNLDTEKNKVYMKSRNNNGENK